MSRFVRSILVFWPFIKIFMGIIVFFVTLVAFDLTQIDFHLLVFVIDSDIDFSSYKIRFGNYDANKNSS